MLNPRRNGARQALVAVAYIGVLLLGCSNKNWQATPSQPAAPVEQKSSLELLREQAQARRGSADPTLKFANRVADQLDAGQPVEPAYSGDALDLIDAAAQAEPLRAAELQHARGRVLYGGRDYEAAVATFEANARDRGHAPSATAAVSYYAAAGQRERLTTFCNEMFPLIRGGNDKNYFIAECVSGMGYASPAEWDKISGPALTEYERWRAANAAAIEQKKQAEAQAIQEQRQAAASVEQAQEDRRNCILRCQEKEAICKTDCYNDVCRDDCSDAEWACRRQC